LTAEGMAGICEWRVEEVNEGEHEWPQMNGGRFIRCTGGRPSLHFATSPFRTGPNLCSSLRNFNDVLMRLAVPILVACVLVPKLSHSTARLASQKFQAPRETHDGFYP
jgi:hypothetical protein